MVKSPRWIRPHTVTVINVLQETDDGEEQTSATELRYVKVELSRKATYGNTGRSYTDTVSVIIDANDLVATKAYVNPADFNNPSLQFTLRLGDRIRYEDLEFEISRIVRTNPLRGTPEFIEVAAA